MKPNKGDFQKIADKTCFPEIDFAAAAKRRMERTMYETRVESNFSAAHFLRDYHGKCENLHGHNYKVFARVAGETLDGGGMLVDFAVLKDALKSVCAALDHTNLNGMELFAQNPSAERIAKYIYDNLSAELNRRGCLARGARLLSIDVFETDTSRARYSAK